MITQKKALEQVESYCKANDMHLSASSYQRNAYAIVLHDSQQGNNIIEGGILCRRISGYLTPKELLIWIDGYNAGLQNK